MTRELKQKNAGSEPLRRPHEQKQTPQSGNRDALECGSQESQSVADGEQATHRSQAVEAVPLGDLASGLGLMVAL